MEEHNNTSGVREEVMIRIEGLKKEYRRGKISAGTLQGAIKERRERARSGGSAVRPKGTFYALDGIDLVVQKGEKLGIIGKNGAGKSTLLKIMSRITAPSEGCVDLYGRTTSMLEVGTGFHGDMTGRENIYLNGAILGMTKAEIDAKMDDIIRFSELEEFIDTPVKRYSSGMFVKLGFSVAYHLDSEIVIMDEVLAVGDVAFQKKCIDSLLQTSMDRNRTILYVSHNMSTVRQLCDRCVVLDKGKVIFDGEPERAIAVYMGAQELMPRSVVYGPEHRPHHYWRSGTPRFEMVRMDLHGREEPVYNREEALRIDLHCAADAATEKVGFRLELWSEDGIKIATSLPGNYLDFGAGGSAARITMPLSNLAPGRYRADIIAFQVRGAKTANIVDAVYPGLYFKVEPAIDQSSYVQWNRKDWGPIRLDDNRVQFESKT